MFGKGVLGKRFHGSVGAILLTTALTGAANAADPLANGKRKGTRFFLNTQRPMLKWLQP